MDSCITLPREPVLIVLPLPATLDASIVSNSPPTSVHAKPHTWPIVLDDSASPNLNFLTPEYFSKFFHDFLTDSPLIPLQSSRSTNQMPRRRSRRNRRNRQQPQTPPANQTASRIIFSSKLKYANSRRDVNGVLILSTHKRPLPTVEELEDHKRKKKTIKAKQICKAALRHKVVSLYENDCNKNDE